MHFWCYNLKHFSFHFKRIPCTRGTWQLNPNVLKKSGVIQVPTYFNGCPTCKAAGENGTYGSNYITKHTLANDPKVQDIVRDRQPKISGKDLKKELERLQHFVQKYAQFIYSNSQFPLPKISGKQLYDFIQKCTYFTVTNRNYAKILL